MGYLNSKVFNKMVFAKIVFLFFLIFSLSASTEYSNALKVKKIYPMGEKIYKKMCTQNIDLKKYPTIEALQNSLKNDNLCKPLKEKNLEALSIYLWDVKRVSSAKNIFHIDVTHDEKCPVCGMFVYKYPKWATQIFYAEKHFSFDGAKDMMKYYFTHKEGISKILVRDYYSQKAIDATKAYFVVGSDIYGPMGHELIPFEMLEEAKAFKKDHKGVKVLEFTKITADEVEKLDE